MKPALRRLQDKLDTSIWLIPAGCILTAAALSFGAEAVDRQLSAERTAWFLFRGGPEGARSILSTVAASIMTLTGVVFSVTILVLQLASTQFSPRALRSFLHDRSSQFVLGFFVATFLYALLGLRSVVGVTDGGVDARVPALTVWLGVVLATGCVGLFIFFVHHIAQSIRVVNVLERIGDTGRQHLARLYPDGLGSLRRDPQPVKPAGLPSLIVMARGRSGVVIGVDEERLMACAVAADVTIALVPVMGGFVAFGSPLLEVWGDAGALDVEETASAVTIGPERNVRQDVAFAVRELVDVAVRALSPGVNDPSTAVQALDQIHDLLRRLSRRRFPEPFRHERGSLRLVLPRVDWNDYVRLSVDEIRHAGEGAVQVARRLRFLLEDLLNLVPAFRRGELLRQLSLLSRDVAQAFPDEREQRVASSPSVPLQDHP